MAVVRNFEGGEPVNVQATLIPVWIPAVKPLSQPKIGGMPSAAIARQVFETSDVKTSR